MDANRFDDVARALIHGTSRRAALGLALVAALTSLGPATADARRRHKRRHRRQQQQQCTSCGVCESCQQGVCRPVADGMCHAVALWFWVELVPGVVLSNEPANVRSHWEQAVQCFASPIPVRAGRPVELGLWQQGRHLLVEHVA